jgi:hypothetical protein
MMPKKFILIFSKTSSFLVSQERVLWFPKLHIGQLPEPSFASVAFWQLV